MALNPSNGSSLERMALKGLIIGCLIGNCYEGCLAYADDIILILASLIKLEKMLDICFRTRQLSGHYI